MKTKIEVAENGNIRVHVPLSLKLREGQKKVVFKDNVETTRLLGQLARAYAWQKAIDEGKFANGKALALALGLDPTIVARTLRLTYLCPAVVHGIIMGDHPNTLTCAIVRGNIPVLWSEQEKAFLK